MSFFVSRTPFRISFFGGGTDYPGWYMVEGGATLSTSIDKYCYLTCRYLPPFFANAYRVVWSHIEMVSHISEILHPAVREALFMMGFENDRGLEIHHQGDLPARAGMGSSSAFANGLLLVLSALRGAPFDQVTLFHKSIELEQRRLKENVGSQDQVATAMGGLNINRFNKDGSITVTPIEITTLRRAELESQLMLFYLGTTRMATRVASEVVANLNDRRTQLREMYHLVWEAEKILSGTGDISEFGRLLHHTWQLKRRIADSVSNSLVDTVYDTARRNGATGGKLLGAGGTGFMLFFVPPDKQGAVREAMGNLLNVPFKFENEGSVLIQTGGSRDLDFMSGRQELISARLLPLSGGTR